MKDNKLRRGLRKKMNSLGFNVVKRYPKMKCRRAAKKDLQVHWVIEETFGYVILNIHTLKSYNVIIERMKLKRLRSRDLNKKAVYRFPKNKYRDLTK